MRLIQLSDLRSRLRKLTDTENDTHLSDTELNEIIASAAAETWDVMISSGIAENGSGMVKKQTFTSTAGTKEYDLETGSGTGLVTADDFYKVHQLYVDEGQGRYRPITRVNPSETAHLMAPQTAAPMVLFYIKAAPTFKSAGVFSDSATFDAVNGWDEHLLMTAAISVKMKKDDDYAQYFRRKQELENRLKLVGNVDWSQAPTVSRIRANKSKYLLSRTYDVCYWGIRAGNLELYAYSPNSPYYAV